MGLGFRVWGLGFGWVFAKVEAVAIYRECSRKYKRVYEAARYYLSRGFRRDP